MVFPQQDTGYPKETRVKASSVDALEAWNLAVSIQINELACALETHAQYRHLNCGANYLAPPVTALQQL
jgi:hypothetical protein